MFDSLADRMKADQRSEINPTERVIRLIAVAVLSATVFGGIYFAVQMLNG